MCSPSTFIMLPTPGKLFWSRIASEMMRCGFDRPALRSTSKTRGASKCGEHESRHRSRSSFDRAADAETFPFTVVPRASTMMEPFISISRSIGDFLFLPAVAVPRADGEPRPSTASPEKADGIFFTNAISNEISCLLVHDRLVRALTPPFRTERDPSMPKWRRTATSSSRQPSWGGPKTRKSSLPTVNAVRSSRVSRENGTPDGISDRKTRLPTHFLTFAPLFVAPGPSTILYINQPREGAVLVNFQNS
mmetsp:Transcript_44249/g.86857  ORF Transcript_44249/g.86857 Transcript_44249/m.86857 type:complete len:249 (-) Transcript_44249:42-788(-)